MKRLLLILALAFTLAGCGGTGGNPNAIHGPKVTGHASWSMFAEGGVNDNITTSNVWCAWAKDGSHVIMHITLHNSSKVAALEVDYNTGYSIVGGGTHGDSDSNDEASTVQANSSRSIFDSAGYPSGIVKYAPIGSCQPYISSVGSPS